MTSRKRRCISFPTPLFHHHQAIASPPFLHADISPQAPKESRTRGFHPQLRPPSTVYSDVERLTPPLLNTHHPPPDSSHPPPPPSTMAAAAAPSPSANPSQLSQSIIATNASARAINILNTRLANTDHGIYPHASTGCEGLGWCAG